VGAEEVGLGPVGVAVAEGWRLVDRAVGRGARAHLLNQMPGSPDVFTAGTRGISHGSAPRSKPLVSLRRSMRAQLQGPGHANQAARQDLDVHKRAVTLNAISHPARGGSADTRHTRIARTIYWAQRCMSTIECSCNQFSVANSRLNPSADGSSD
jgi:hypothetical protein